MPTIFSRIVAGEIPAHRIAETDRCLAFLDIRPLAKGHTLVIPKQEVNYIFDVGDETLAEMMQLAKRVAKAIEQNVSCLRIGVAVIGLEVPHAHIHLVPLRQMGDLNFANPPVQLSTDEFADIARRIRQTYEAQNG